MPISPERSAQLSRQRADLIRRIKSGKPGVTALRERLRQITHQQLKEELSDG